MTTTMTTTRQTTQTWHHKAVPTSSRSANNAVRLENFRGSKSHISFGTHAQISRYPGRFCQKWDDFNEKWDRNLEYNVRFYLKLSFRPKTHPPLPPASLQLKQIAAGWQELSKQKNPLKWVNCQVQRITLPPPPAPHKTTWICVFAAPPSPSSSKCHAILTPPPITFPSYPLQDHQIKSPGQTTVLRKPGKNKILQNQPARMQQSLIPPSAVQVQVCPT